MFVIVYEFRIKPGRAEAFVSAWSEFTVALRRGAGSLGSRLHATEHRDVYLAYAQWPSADAFDHQPGDEAFTPGELDARTRMRDAVEGVTVVHRGPVLVDHLRSVNS